MIALDTNILIYAEQRDDPSGKGDRAADLVLRLTDVDAIIPIQVLAEFFNVCARKLKLTSAKAQEAVDLYHRVFQCPVTLHVDLMDASLLAERYRLAYFDALICTISRRAGATTLLSEDMADRMEIDGLRIVNPFNPENKVLLAHLLE